MALFTVLVLPMALMTLWTPSTYAALMLLMPLQVTLLFCYGPTFSFVQTLSPPRMRATMASIFILLQVLSGGVIGIQLLGIMSDMFTPVLGGNEVALRWSITLGCPLALWAALHFWLAGRSIRQNLAAAA